MNINKLSKPSNCSSRILQSWLYLTSASHSQCTVRPARGGLALSLHKYSMGWIESFLTPRRLSIQHSEITVQLTENVCPFIGRSTYGDLTWKEIHCGHRSFCAQVAVLAFSSRSTSPSCKNDC